MPEIMNLDYETRSTVNLPKTGAHVYAKHPSTTILCAAYAFDDGPVKLWLPGHSCPEEIIEHVNAGKPVHAHNCAFERLIWWHVAERLYGWPHAELEQFWDTAAAAAACALPRALGDAAAALNSPHKKDPLGYQVMMKLSKPRGYTEAGEPIWYEDEEKFKILCAYCMADVEAERAIAKRIPKLGVAEREVFLLDQRINERGVMVDLPLVKAAEAIAEQETSSFQRKLAAITKGAVTKPTQVQRMKAWLAEQGVELETLGSKAVAGVLKDDKEAGGILPKNVLEALSNRLLAAKSSLGKLATMQQVAGDDGRARGLLMYHGASTGRWSGKAIQTQNFPRGMKMPKGWEEIVLPLIQAGDVDSIQALFGPILDVLSTALRPMLRAAPGNKLIAADYAAVEARGVAWLAGCETLLQQFREYDAGIGPEVYCVAATGIFKTLVEKFMEFERFVGKQTVLGSGYGLGWRKFILFCEGFGIKITEELAQQCISWYRETYHEVPKLWRGVETAAIEAVRSPGIITEAAGGKLKFRVRGEFLWMVLPSGRPLAYYNPKLEPITTPWGTPGAKLSFMAVDPKTKKWWRQTTWGGTLVENATQGLCRDLLVNGMMNAEEKNYLTIMHAHDEAVCEVPEDFGTVAEYERLLCDLPPWASGFPLKAEGWSGPRYKK